MAIRAAVPDASSMYPSITNWQVSGVAGKVTDIGVLKSKLSASGQIQEQVEY